MEASALACDRITQEPLDYALAVATIPALIVSFDEGAIVLVEVDPDIGAKPLWGGVEGERGNSPWSGNIKIWFCPCVAWPSRAWG